MQQPSKLRRLVGPVYQTLVAGKQKAIAAFVIGAVATLAAKHGLTVNLPLQTALQALLVGVIAHVGVYFTPNK